MNTEPDRGWAIARWLLPVGWVLAAAGYCGPWIGHRTAALTLTGTDMAEFVKFLPGVLDGSLRLARQFFYLPPFAVAIGIALLVHARPPGLPRPVRAASLLLAVPVSLQMLPPAWSPASLLSPEFRLQPAAILLCWLLLVGSWQLGRLPVRVTGPLAGGVALVAAVLTCSQLLAVKPAIDAVYGRPPATGWGAWLGLAGLILLALASASLAWPVRTRNRAARRTDLAGNAHAD